MEVTEHPSFLQHILVEQPLHSQGEGQAEWVGTGHREVPETSPVHAGGETVSTSPEAGHGEHAPFP